RLRRAMVTLRRAGTHRAWTPDQQRTTPHARRVAQHPGNATARGFYSSRLRGIMAYGTHAPSAPDELAGQPGPYRPARKRPDPRFLRTLLRRRPPRIARDGLHRYAAPDFRRPRISLERRRDQRKRRLRIWLDQRGRGRGGLAEFDLLLHAGTRPRGTAGRAR